MRTLAAIRHDWLIATRERNYDLANEFAREYGDTFDHYTRLGLEPIKVEEDQ